MRLCDKRDGTITCMCCRNLHQISMLLGLFQKDLFKGRRMKLEAAFFLTKLLSRKVCSLPRSPVLLRHFTNTKMAAAVKNLTFTDEELPLHVLVGYKQKMKAKALIGRL